MELLSAVVTVVGMVATVNLVLTMGVIRRLRDHTERLSALPPGGALTASVLPPGATVGQFVTTDVRGERLALTDLTGFTVVGFFSPGCEPCRELLPRYASEVAGLPSRGWHVVAVVVAEPDEDWSAYRELLAPVPHTVVEQPGGPVQRAFGAAGFPAIAVVAPDHTVVASGSDATPLAAVGVVPTSAVAPAPRGGSGPDGSGPDDAGPDDAGPDDAGPDDAVLTRA